MIDPFSKPTTPQEWRARGRLLQRQLEGLTIDELMRGVGPTAANGQHARGYDPNQPRVPAGHPEGGQWKSNGGGGGINDPHVLSLAAPDNDWIWGPDYAGYGHHYAARQAWQDLPLRPETRRVFETAVSGPLPDKVWSRREQRWLRHTYDQAHREYNVAVSKLIGNYMRAHRIRPRQMTPDQAEDIIAAIHASSDLRISRYNAMIKLMRGYYLRFGPRGNE